VQRDTAVGRRRRGRGGVCVLVQARTQSCQTPTERGCWRTCSRGMPAVSGARDLQGVRASKACRTAPCGALVPRLLTPCLLMAGGLGGADLGIGSRRTLVCVFRRVAQEANEKGKQEEEKEQGQEKEVVVVERQQFRRGASPTPRGGASTSARPPPAIFTLGVGCRVQGDLVACAQSAQAAGCRVP
jgi:hypothetical protein